MHIYTEQRFIDKKINSIMLLHGILLVECLLNNLFG